MYNRQSGQISNRSLIIIGLILSFLVVPILVSVFASQNDGLNRNLTNTPPERDASQIKSAVTASVPVLKNGDFTVTKYIRIDPNWYVAWLDGKDVKVLINDAYDKASGMKVILGPASTFDENDALSRGVPSKMYKRFIDEKIN